MNTYVHEKLLALEAEMLSKVQITPEPAPRRTIFGGVVAATGRTLRRAGEGLESWANHPFTEADERLIRRAP